MVPRLVGAGINALSHINPQAAARKTLDLFTTPRKGDVRPHHQAFLSAFHRRTLAQKSLDIALYSSDGRGHGPSVLLCHGWESNSFRWRKLAPRLLSAGATVHMIDAPAHGASGSDRFNAILYKESIQAAINMLDPKVIVGHSVGAFSTLWAAAEVEARLERLVLLAPPESFVGITDRYFDMLGLSTQVRRHYDDLIVDVFGFTSDHFRLSNLASSVDYPTLLVHGRGDRINPYTDSVVINSFLPQSELISLETDDHSLQIDEVLDRVVEFACSEEI